MLKTLLAAGALLCASFAVNAAECEYRFDAMIGEFSAGGAPIVIIDPADLPAIVEKVQIIVGHPLGEVTRGFFVQAGGKVLLGLEVDGCLIDPIFLGLVQPAQQLSGKDESGKIGA